MGSKRIVISGLGTLCPLGLNTKQAWTRLIAGKSGITRLPDEKYENVPSKVAAKLYEGFQIEDNFSKSDLRSTSLSAAYALKATEEALHDSQLLTFPDLDKDRVGVSIGIGMVELPEIYDGIKKFEDAYNKLSPFFMPRILLNMVTGHICLKYGFRGPSHCVSTACATGLHSIGDSFYFLQNSNADVMVCGASEAPINPVSMAGFCRLRALSTNFNETPDKASRPFDVNRDGFVMGEGSAILVLETLEHARKRNALDRVYCEILGYGMSNDAYHVTKPSPDGIGAQLCMQQALRAAKLEPKYIGYINAHATSTPIGDEIEVRAVQKVFGSDFDNVLISSTKGSHGHLLGSAGSLESVFTVMSMKENVLPPNMNLVDPDVNVTMANFVKQYGQRWPNTFTRKFALKNSFGFGGTNASIVFGEFIP